MPTTKDYYDILGVDKNASDSEIKKAYRKMAMKYHPDRNKGDDSSEQKFKEASEAYDVLKDPQKRARYDQYGHSGLHSDGFNEQDFHDINIEDIFSRFGDIFGSDIFGGAGGRGGRGRSRSRARRSAGQRGSDMKLNIELTLEEIAFGTEKKLKVKKQVQCDACDGTGAETSDDYETCSTCNGMGEVRQVNKTMFGQFVNVQACPNCNGEGRIIRNKCSKCNGQGRVTGKETVKVRIPAGVSSGNYITMRNSGNAGVRGGEAGDLIVLIEEKEHEQFERDQNDIYYDLVLSIPDATLGTEVEVPTLKGKAKLKIDEGTQPGKLLRMKGRGIQGLNGAGTGDQYIRVNVYIPKNLSNEEKKKIASLKEADNFDPVHKKESKKGFFSKIKDVFS